MTKEFCNKQANGLNHRSRGQRLPTLTLSSGEREKGEDIFDRASGSLTYSTHRTSSKSAERFSLSLEERAGVRIPRFVSRIEPLNQPLAAVYYSYHEHPPAVPSPLPSDGRGEGQGEVRVRRVHGEEVV